MSAVLEERTIAPICFSSSFLAHSGRGGVARADSAQAAEPGGAPPPGGAAAVQPDPVVAPPVSPAVPQQPGPDPQQQPPGQADPQGLQGHSVGFIHHQPLHLLNSSSVKGPVDKIVV